jgi:class 3 adenylate cyclase
MSQRAAMAASEMPSRIDPASDMARRNRDIRIYGHRGSTRAWELYPDAMKAALKDHNRLLRDAVKTHHGYVFKTVGDAFCCVFSDSTEALAAAVDAMRRLHAQSWPEKIDEIRVRMAIHTGAAAHDEGDYFGPTVNRVARLMSIARGGQILLSSSTVDALTPPISGITLRNLGSHRLKDLKQAEVTYQVVADALRVDFPALASLDAHPQQSPLPDLKFRREEAGAGARSSVP